MTDTPSPTTAAAAHHLLQRAGVGFTWTGGRTLSRAHSTDGDRGDHGGLRLRSGRPAGEKTVTVRKYHTPMRLWPRRRWSPAVWMDIRWRPAPVGLREKTNIAGKWRAPVHRHRGSPCHLHRKKKAILLKTCTGCGATIKTNYTNAFGHSKHACPYRNGEPDLYREWLSTFILVPNVMRRYISLGNRH